MLFNSYFFLFVFLPTTLAGVSFLGAFGWKRWIVAWLLTASLFFYAWWNVLFLPLLVGSLLFNYSLGLLCRTKHGKDRLVLVFGIACNLALLVYFKYADFFMAQLTELAGLSHESLKLTLPLAISFFTFQQIAYLVDSYRGAVVERNILRYMLFVTFFPHLIAGPLVHHREMIPQFSMHNLLGISFERLAPAITIFTIGLIKKVVISDSLSTYVDPAFAAAETDIDLTFLEAWCAAIAFALKIYFDFSAYSEMAAGISFMFGIRLPINFFSPYKAQSIIDFWRRWHITLSRFLRDYLYIPLGGSRKGRYRQAINIFITMGLGGFWHGAGWTFIIWGVLHGIYLSVNHVFRHLTAGRIPDTRSSRFVFHAVTFLSVLIAWVFFRADSLSGACNIIFAMAGGNGIALPPTYLQHLNHLGQLGAYFQDAGLSYVDMYYFQGAVELVVIASLLLWVWLAPNVHEFTDSCKAVLEIYKPERQRRESWHQRVTWKPSLSFASLTAAILSACLFTMYFSGEYEFIYFQF